MEEMNKLTELLNKANQELPKRAREYAEAYTEYRMILSKEIIIERDKGTPVTILVDIVKGKEEVAIAKQSEIITEGLYKSCLEAINSFKLQIKVLQERINRDID